VVLKVAHHLRGDHQSVTESIFAEALTRAQSSGQPGREHDASALARFFVVTIQGMRAIVRLNPQ